MFKEENCVPVDNNSDSSKEEDGHLADDVMTAATKMDNKQATMDEYDCFVLKPKQLLENIKDNPDNQHCKMKLLLHMENYTSIHHDHKAKKSLVPSAYLDVAQTE